MNTQKWLVVFLIISLMLSGCAPKAAATRVAEVTRQQAEKPKAAPTVVAAQPTQAPMAEPERIGEQNPPEERSPLSPTTLPLSTSAPVAGNQPNPSGRAPRDNYFQDYGVNPEIDTRRDHLSTFALDVDTASYTLMRKYINDGYLPPFDAVRVEEYVNYFDPGYPNPEKIGFAIYADGAPSPYLEDREAPFEGEIILRFGIQGYQVSENERKPVALTLLVDTSGSMSYSGRIDLVKDALKLLVERLRPDDSVAIVAYSRTSKVVLNPTRTRDQRRILKAIDQLSPGGSTNLEAGLNLAYQLAMENFRPEAENRVILCSDGVANVGNINPDTLLEEIHGYVDEGISLSSYGFGMGNYNDVLLEQMADRGDGQYAYVDDRDEAERLFVENLTSVLTVIGKDAKVQVDFNPDVVETYRLLGYENRAVADQDFRNDAVDAGEIGAGQRAVALYTVKLRPEAEGRIATVQLRWRDAETDENHEINGNFNTWNLAQNFEDADPRYQLAVVVAMYAEILRESPWVAGYTLRDLQHEARRVAGLLPGDDDVTEFAHLVAQAVKISRRATE